MRMIPLLPEFQLIKKSKPIKPVGFFTLKDIDEDTWNEQTHWSMANMKSFLMDVMPAWCEIRFEVYPTMVITSPLRDTKMTVDLHSIFREKGEISHIKRILEELLKHYNREE